MDMTNSRPLLFYILFSLQMVILSTCAPPKLTNEPVIESPFADRSFITDEPCSAPCWHGLEVDKSTKDEVYAVLYDLDIVDQASIYETIQPSANYENASFIGYDCVYKTRGVNCGVLIVSSDGILRVILHVVAYPLSLQDIIGHLGPPGLLTAYPYSPHGGDCVITLLWEEKGISVEHIDKETSLLCDAIREGSSVDPNTLVHSLNYVSLDIAIQWKEILTYIPWPGFEN